MVVWLYKKILIATDGSEASKKASLRGVALAKESGAKIIGVHILDKEELNIMDIGSQELAHLKNKQRDEGRKALSDLEELCKKSKVGFEKVLKEGEPSEEIIKIANRRNADLILLGSHGRRGLSKIIEGSISGEVKEECPTCPIMIVV